MDDARRKSVIQISIVCYCELCLQAVNPVMASLCRRAVPSIPFMTRLVCRGLQVSSVPSGAQPQPIEPKQDDGKYAPRQRAIHYKQLND